MQLIGRGALATSEPNHEMGLRTLQFRTKTSPQLHYCHLMLIHCIYPFASRSRKRLRESINSNNTE